MRTNYPLHHKLKTSSARYQTFLFIKMASILILLSSILFFVTGCKKLLEVDAPITSSNGDNVYLNDATAIAVLTGIYANMGAFTFGRINFTTGGNSISLLTGLSSDEFTLYNGVTNNTYISYYKNALNPVTTPTSGTEFWSELYNSIYICNSAIEGLTKGSALTPSVKQQLLGEAKFMRAFFYFYLVNLFGDVPLVLSTEYKGNAALERTPKAIVYKQIIIDLQEAQSLLSSDYLDGSLQKYRDIPDRVRPTKWAATALLSRVYLYSNDYNNADLQASLIINNSSIHRLTDLTNAFLKNNDEAIWQLQPVNYGRNTEDAFTFIIPSTGLSNNNPVSLSSNLLNSFEPGDKRKTDWTNNIMIGSDTFYYPNKYKSATQDAPITEYLVIFRLSEQYLIRAEARIHLGKLDDAKSDLNAIRARAGLPDIQTVIPDTLLAAILHERQVELFSEWGHRWLDLKRTAKANTVMQVVTEQKGGNWNTNWQLYPLPLSDIQKDFNLKQNPGY